MVMPAAAAAAATRKKYFAMDRHETGIWMRPFSHYFSPATTMATALRQWRYTPGLQRENRVKVFNVQDESKVAKADAVVEDASDDPVVHVHDISTSRVLQ